MGAKTEDRPKNALSRRFLELVNEIQKLNPKISDAELCRQISGNPKNKDLINKIRKGITEPQYQDIEVFSKLFNINKEYILTGLMPKYLLNHSSGSLEQPNYEVLTREQLIADLLEANKKLIAAKDDVIAEKNNSLELLKRIDQLQEEIKRLGYNKIGA